MFRKLEFERFDAADVGKLQFIGVLLYCKRFQIFSRLRCFSTVGRGLAPAASSISKGFHGERRGVPRSELASFGGSERAPALQRKAKFKGNL